MCWKPPGDYKHHITPEKLAHSLQAASTLQTLARHPLHNHKILGVTITRSVTRADTCWTDHRFISSTRMKILPKRTHQNQNPIKKFNVNLLQDINHVQKFQQNLHKQLHNKSTNLKIYRRPLNWLGSRWKKKPHQDWLDDNDTQLEQHMDQREKLSSPHHQSAIKRKLD